MPRGLEIMWSPREGYSSLLRDRARSSHNHPGEAWPQPIQVFGRSGTLFRQGTWGFTAVLAPNGPSVVEIRTTPRCPIGSVVNESCNAGSEREFRDLLGKLYSADVETWLAALPESVVKPSDVAGVIAEMLSDIPVPNGFDRRSINPGATTERYHVGAQVSGAVACAWIGAWSKARQTGDTAGVRAAVERSGRATPGRSCSRCAHRRLPARAVGVRRPRCQRQGPRRLPAGTRLPLTVAGTGRTFLASRSGRQRRPRQDSNLRPTD
jgi:hypothetical protein